ncbi:MAG: hypothetical protein ACLU7D_09090 [Collinsella sp.]
MFHNIPRHCWNDVLAGFGCGIPSKFRVLAGKNGPRQRHAARFSWWRWSPGRGLPVLFLFLRQFHFPRSPGTACGKGVERMVWKYCHDKLNQELFRKMAFALAEVDGGIIPRCVLTPHDDAVRPPADAT